MSKTILITGGSGLIGRALSKHLISQGYTVRWLTRSNKPTSLPVTQFLWKCGSDCIDSQALRNVDIVIHLAGANIAERRWTTNRKREIIDSRCKSLDALAHQCSVLHHWPQAVISASATGFYSGVPFAGLHNEQSPAGTSFTAHVCTQWEQSLEQFQLHRVRTVSVRTGIVLSADGGALAPLKRITGFGLAAPLASGKQIVSWIHIDDLCRIYEFLIEQELSGAFNAVSPQNISNFVFMQQLAQSMKKPFIFPAVPAWLLKIALGERAQMLLEGATIEPQRLLKKGFHFLYTDYKQALENLLHQRGKE